MRSYAVDAAESYYLSITIVSDLAAKMFGHKLVRAAGRFQSQRLGGRVAEALEVDHLTLWLERLGGR